MEIMEKNIRRTETSDEGLKGYQNCIYIDEGVVKRISLSSLVVRK